MREKCGNSVLRKINGLNAGKLKRNTNILQILKKYIPNHYPELEIWKSCLQLLAGNSNFKLRIMIWNFLGGRFGDLKNQISLSENRYLYILPRYYSKDLKDLSFKLRTPAKSSH